MKIGAEIYYIIKFLFYYVASSVISLWNVKYEFNHNIEYFQTLYQTFKILQEWVDMSFLVVGASEILKNGLAWRYTLHKANGPLTHCQKCPRRGTWTAHRSSPPKPGLKPCSNQAKGRELCRISGHWYKGLSQAAGTDVQQDLHFVLLVLFPSLLYLRHDGHSYIDL